MCIDHQNNHLSIFLKEVESEEAKVVPVFIRSMTPNCAICLFVMLYLPVNSNGRCLHFMGLLPNNRIS